MSKAKIGGSIVLDGAAEYRRQLSEITAGLKVNYAQMGLVATQYKNAGDSAEALRAKANALGAAIQGQKDKIAVMTERLQDSVKATGEGSKQTMAYQADLIKAQTQLEKMQQELNGYRDKAQGATQGTVTMADAVNGLTQMLGINVPPAMQSAIDKLDGISVSGAAAATVIAGVVGKLSSLTVEAAQTADELLTLSSTTGLTTDTLQELRYASELVDVSVDTISGSMTKMIRSMESAKKGTGDAAEAFAALGIHTTDSMGQLRDAESVFSEVIDALGQMSNETERDALSMEIFGKSARELNPLIETGGGKLRELAQEAHEVGYVMSGETLQGFGQLDDAMQRFNNQSDALKNSLALTMLPLLTDLFETINKIPVSTQKNLIVLATTVTTVLLVVKAIRDVSGSVQGVMTLLNPAKAAMLKTTGIVLGVVAALVALGVVIAVIAGKSNDLERAMNSVSSSVGGIQSTVTAAQQSYPRNATGSRFWRGGETIVGERGPELVRLPRGSQIYPTGSHAGGGGSFTDNSTTIFKVEDIETYARIERRMKNERVTRRKGYVGV